MDINTIWSLILQELRLIRDDIKEEIRKICYEIKNQHVANTRKTLDKEQELYKHKDKHLQFMETRRCCLEKTWYKKDVSCLPISSFVSPMSESSHCKNKTISQSLSTIMPDTSQHFVSLSPSVEKLNKISPVEEIFEHRSNTINETDKLVFTPIFPNVIDVKSIIESDCYFDQSNIAFNQKKWNDDESSNISSTNCLGQKCNNISSQHCSDTGQDSITFEDSESLDCSLPSKDLNSSFKSSENNINLRCKFCSQVFSINSSYNAHLKTHIGSEQSAYDLCSETSSSVMPITKHELMDSCHNTKRKHKCEYCDKAFTQKQKLRHHIRVHTGEKPHKCDVCNKAFAKKINLDTHFRIHTGEKPFKCEKFNKRFVQSSNLTNHLRTHTGEKPYNCMVCHKSFSSTAVLNEHVLIHTGERPFNCSICNKDFRARANFNIHIRTHTGYKPFICSFCSKGFVDSSSLTRHIRIHTGEKPYICQICNKSFSESTRLTKHIRIHTGEKPYKCQICHKSFSESTRLTKHIRIHTGEKPYECQICHKSFSESPRLTKHIRTHTGEKPYNCQICNKSFSESQRLTKHIRIHTRKES